jgi:hypothetical protein
MRQPRLVSMHAWILYSREARSVPECQCCDPSELVQLVLRNLLLADWFDEDHTESFLNQKRSKRSRELLQNVRKACCVAGQFDIEVTLASPVRLAFPCHAAARATFSTRISHACHAI